MPPKSAKRNSPGKNKQDMAVYKCSACSKVIKSSLDAKLHPLIGALVCRKCNTTYGNGNFAELFEEGVDELGDDNYCRWCCDGGDLFGCMNEEGGKERCHYSFCKDCIKRNIPDDEILTIDDLDEEGKQKLKWLCYACDASKIAKLRKDAKEALKELIRRGEKRTEPSEASSKTIPSQPVKNGAKTSNSDTKTTDIETKATSSDIKATIDSTKATKEDPKPTINNIKTNKDDLKTSSNDTRTTKAEPKPTNNKTSKDEPKTPNNNKTAQDDPKTPKNTNTTINGSKTTNIDSIPTNNSKSTKDDPKTPNNNTKTTTNDTKTSNNSTKTINNEPKATNNDPKATNNDPKATNNDPKATNNDPKATHNDPKATNNDPKATNNDPKATNNANKTANNVAHSAPKRRKLEENETKEPSSSSNQPPPSKRRDTIETSLRPPLVNVEIFPIKRRETITNVVSKLKSSLLTPQPKKQQQVKIIPTPQKLSDRLEVYRKTKDICVEEIGIKFDNIVEMKAKGLSKKIIDIEIDSLIKPIQEFQTMLNDLRSHL